MLRGTKPEAEVRFELLTWGIALIVLAVLYVLFWKSVPMLRPLLLFLPGLILLGGAIYQDMQPEWRVGWPYYALAILVVATGLAGLINGMMGNLVNVPWWIVIIVELGAIFIVKALYDPTPR